MNRIIITALLISFLTIGCATVSDKPHGKATTQNRLGYVLPRYNFSIDAAYDPRTAHMIDGYTSLTVAVTNKGFQPLRLRPDKDRWKVQDRKGHWHTGITDIQYEAPEKWYRLHPRAKKLILYPDVVPPGYTQTFQIFVSGEINMAGFDRIKHYNGTLKKTFTFTRY